MGLLCVKAVLRLHIWFIILTTPRRLGLVAPFYSWGNGSQVTESTRMVSVKAAGFGPHALGHCPSLPLPLVKILSLEGNWNLTWCGQIERNGVNFGTITERERVDCGEIKVTASGVSLDFGPHPITQLSVWEQTPPSEPFMRSRLFF